MKLEEAEVKGPDLQTGGLIFQGQPFISSTYGTT